MLIAVLIIMLLIEVYFSPRLDLTENNRLLVWYGKVKRNYFILI